jgi:hypothetical protein
MGFPALAGEEAMLEIAVVVVVVYCLIGGWVGVLSALGDGGIEVGCMGALLWPYWMVMSLFVWTYDEPPRRRPARAELLAAMARERLDPANYRLTKVPVDKPETVETPKEATGGTRTSFHMDETAPAPRKPVDKPVDTPQILKELAEIKRLITLHDEQPGKATWDEWARREARQAQEEARQDSERIRQEAAEKGKV